MAHYEQDPSHSMQMYIRMQQKCKAQLAGSVVVYEFEI